MLADHLISTAVTQSALGRPLRGLVHLVLRLLQQKDKASFYENIAVAEHPLSRILTNQGKSASILFSSIRQFLIISAEKDCVERSGCLKAAITSLTPLTKFVLADGSHSLEFVDAMLDSASILLLSAPTEAKTLIEMIDSTISNRNTIRKSGGRLLPVVAKLGFWSLDHCKFFEESSLKWNLISLLVTVCWNAVDTDDNDHVLGALHLLKKLLRITIITTTTTTTTKGEENDCKDELMFICAMMLMKVDQGIALQCLHIIMMVLPSHVSCLPVGRLKVLLSVLVLPTIQLLYENKPAEGQQKSQLVVLGENLLRNIESFLSVPANIDDAEVRVTIPENPFSEIINVAQNSLSKLSALFHTKELALSWFKDITMTHATKKTFMARDNIVLQLSSLLVFNADETVFKEGLNAMISVCTRNPNLVSVFLPLLLYLLKNKRYENVKLAILYCFPKIATGKTVISSILKVILSLSECVQLLPVCIMLMTTLWLEQPRIYPYLLQLLSKERQRGTATLPEFWFQHTLARVTSILQVCVLCLRVQGLIAGRILGFL